MPAWDALVRLTHWSLAALVLWDWFEDSGGPLHRNLGYLAAAIVVLRLAWACVGPRPARFADWWPTRTRVLAHLRELRRGNAPRRHGHNPLGALMMIALWSLVLALAVTGWMSRLDAFWGDEGIIELHGWLADALIALGAVHVIAVVVMSWVQGENLVAAMISGRRRAD